MDNTMDALKKLYVALGGSLTDTYNAIADGATVSNYVTIPDMINAIAALISSGATAELPEVDADDNGKVLKVADGKWSVGTDATD